MKKALRILTLALAFAGGLPLLIIVAAVVVVSIAAKAIRSRKKDRDDK